jgi:hypothetical protein
MDIQTQAEILLRQTGFETWSLTTMKPPVTCFENPSIAGFLFVFDSAAELRSTWEERQTAVLARFAPVLRVAGAKAWNIYSVLLTENANADEARAVAELEEDFTLTRKIARVGIRTQHDLEQALLPLRRIQSQPKVGEANFESRLRDQLLLLRTATVDAFLGEAEPASVAQMLEKDAS